MLKSGCFVVSESSSLVVDREEPRSNESHINQNLADLLLL